MKPTTMRDAFFDRFYELASQNRDILLISADMGAPSLDKFRRDLPGQFINVGIAEQNMIALATGLALAGKKVFTYAIAPFATSRCHEFIKVNASLMNLGIVVIGVGAGFSYDDSGPTHHTTEDISIIRPLPNMVILSPSDSVLAAGCADIACSSKSPMYIRLDRHVLPAQYKPGRSFSAGFSELRKGKGVCILATGNMVQRAIEVRDACSAAGLDVGVIDLYRLKPLPTGLKRCLARYDLAVTLEEHILDGGLGSIIAELVVDNDLGLRLHRMGLDRYIYAYGGRENIQRIVGLDVDSIRKALARKWSAVAGKAVP